MPSDIRHCRNCARSNPIDAKFCNNCGSPIANRCAVCNAEVSNDAGTCDHCGFSAPHDGFVKLLEPSSLPERVGSRVLSSLNEVPSAKELWQRVELLGEDDTGVEVAQRILDARATAGGRFTSLDQVSGVPGLGAARFTELVLALGTDPVPFVPDVSQRDYQPAGARPSASMTELEFEYKIVAPGPFEGLGGAVVARACSRCAAFAPSFNNELEVWESQVEITGLVLGGEDDNIAVAITMDERMLPFDWMQPLDKQAGQFQFPAKMQLNNSMIIKAKLKSTDEVITLVSRDVPCQAGRVINWPPHGMRLHAQRKIVYVREDDPLGKPVLEIGDATTYLTGPCVFFDHRADITEYQYIAGAGPRDLPAVRLVWRPVPADAPGGDLLDHYHVYRSMNPRLGEGGWQNVSGHVSENTWIDPNPPRGPLYYHVVCVTKTLLGDDYEGPPGQVKRVEPADSVFRV